MNVIVRHGISLEEFLAWERQQPLRYEFDGIQPIPMTGGTLGHARLIKRLMRELERVLPERFEALGGDIKVRIPATNRVRYPDVLVLPAGADPNIDIVDPIVVVEVLSSATSLTDLHVKPDKYGSVPSIAAYVILPQGGPDGATVLRRSNRLAARANRRCPRVAGDLRANRNGSAVPAIVAVGTAHRIPRPLHRRVHARFRPISRAATPGRLAAMTPAARPDCCNISRARR